MRFYTTEHRFYCGIDLHARSMYLCIVGEDGAVLLHRNYRADRESFLKAVAPYRSDLVVAVECIFCWYWLADLCEEEGIEFVLGHALYMKAIHGGKTKNDKIDSEKIARLLRGGTLPVGYVYPRRLRSTRDLLRRRLYLTRKRAELLAHVQMTNSQYNLPALGKLAHNRANRHGVAERFDDPSVSKSVEIDLGLTEYLDKLIKGLEDYLVKVAREQEPRSLVLLRTVPGIGKVLSLVILYEIERIERFARVQDFASYARLVRCPKESVGKKTGGASGKKIGNVHLKWAFSEAAALFIRGEGPERKFYQKLERKHGKGKALSVLAAKLGRACYYMLKRREIFDMERFTRS